MAESLDVSEAAAVERASDALAKHDAFFAGTDEEWAHEGASKALAAACDPALGDQRLVPLSAVLDVLACAERDYLPGAVFRMGIAHARLVLNRHFDLPTQGAREDGEPDGQRG